MYNHLIHTEWDLHKARINERKHGVSFADAVPVLDDPMALTAEDDSHGEPRFQVIGMDALGRVLAVVFTYRGEAVRIIERPQGRKVGTRTLRGVTP